MNELWLTDLLIQWKEYLSKIYQNHDWSVGSHPNQVFQVYLQVPFCFGNYKPANWQLFSLI